MPQASWFFMCKVTAHYRQYKRRSATLMKFYNSFPKSEIMVFHKISTSVTCLDSLFPPFGLHTKINPMAVWKPDNNREKTLNTLQVWKQKDYQRKKVRESTSVVSQTSTRAAAYQVWKNCTMARMPYLSVVATGYTMCQASPKYTTWRIKCA